MTINYKTEPTNQEVASLYYLVGEAICMIQHLEGALSVSITLKKDVLYPYRIPKEKADNFLKEYRSLPLGKAIQLAKKNGLYSDTLYRDLAKLLEERNWLVHKFIIYSLDDMYVASTRDNLFHRIKVISNKAKTLQGAINTDLIKFSESVGLDMSRIHAYIKQYSHEG